MGEAATPVTHDRQILGNCVIGPSDTRGSEYVQALTQQIDQQRFYSINPNILTTSYTAPKLQWLRDNEPSVYDRTDKFLLWGGLVEKGPTRWSSSKPSSSSSVDVSAASTQAAR